MLLQKGKSICMRILSVAWKIHDDQFMNNYTGLGVVVKNLCEHLGRKEESFLLIGSRLLPEMKIGNMHIVKSNYNPEMKNVKGSNSDYIQYMTTVFKRVVDEIRPDIINFHGYGDMAFSCIENICIPQKLLYVVTEHLFIGKHDIDVFREYDEKIVNENRLYNIPDLSVIAVSHGMKKKILKDLPTLSEQQVKVILNGTDFSSECIESDLLYNYKVQNKKILLCVGSLNERKNQRQIISAFMKKKELSEKICVMFCGKDGMNGRLQKEINESQFSESLIYVGAVSNQDMKKYYTIADGLIMSSYAEGLSIAALEAIVYGLPIIMFSDSECAEDLDDPEVICFAEQHTDDALAEAIQAWSEKEWNKEYIKEYAGFFTMDRMTQDYLDYYRELTTETNLGA